MNYLAKNEVLMIGFVCDDALLVVVLNIGNFCVDGKVAEALHKLGRES